MWLGCVDVVPCLPCRYFACMVHGSWWTPCRGVPLQLTLSLSMLFRQLMENITKETRTAVILDNFIWVVDNSGITRLPYTGNTLNSAKVNINLLEMARTAWILTFSVDLASLMRNNSLMMVGRKAFWHGGLFWEATAISSHDNLVRIL